jgi:hypothetical protein
MKKIIKFCYIVFISGYLYATSNVPNIHSATWFHRYKSQLNDHTVPGYDPRPVKFANLVSHNKQVKSISGFPPSRE